MSARRWIKLVTRPMTLLTVDGFLKGVRNQMPILLDTKLDLQVSINNSLCTVFEGTESRNALNSHVAALDNKDKSFLQNHLIEGRKRYKNFVSVSQNFQRTEKLKSKRKLIIHFLAYRDAYFAYSPFLHTVFSAEKILTEKLKELVLSVDTFRALTFIEQQTDFYKERENLLKLSIKYRNNKMTPEDLSLHTKRFGYMGLTNSFLSEPYSQDYFMKLIGSHQNPQEELSRLTQKKGMELAAYKLVSSGTTPKIRSVAKLLQSYMMFRNDRVKALKIAQHNAKPLLYEICNLHHVDFNDIVWYTFDEIADLINSSKKVDVSQRKKFFSASLRNGTIDVQTRTTSTNSSTKKRILTGYIASRGNVKGFAKLVFSVEDMSKIEQGDILITSMTTPDLVPSMRKVAAIVTDEGGILCHAAIISRELGIPCIVGTSTATSVFQDGDLIELDTDKGTVISLES